MIFKEEKVIKLSEDASKNILFANDRYYSIDFLKEKNKYVHGGNGYVFKLVDSDDDEFVIKILKFPTQWASNWKIKKRILRFEREIEALYIAKENSVPNVVEIHFHGDIFIDGFEFQYYVMQKCDCTLTEYLTDKTKELETVQKVLLCQKILRGIMGMHEYSLYHRDIKNENIFFVGNEPLVGDLGLVANRDSDFKINEYGELIGPTGWLTPEAMNKYLVERAGNINEFDITIDEKSEIFQLGKLFWYIFQGNVPIGQIELGDFKPNQEEIFELLFKMLSYSKDRRFSPMEAFKGISTFLQTH